MGLMPRILFQPAARYPADPRAIFILALSVFSGLVSLAVEQGPGTLEALLPYWGVTLWGAILCVGSAVTLIGLAMQSVNGIIIEQIGSVAVGAATLFYSALAIWIVGLPAVQAVGLILGWGLSCFVRWIQLQLLLVKMNHEKIEAQALLMAQGMVQRQEITEHDAEDLAEGRRIERES
jgi:hypothetical protein